MKQNFFKYVPSEVIINILSRLPIRTIISCKCVCKSWHDLLETDEFVKSHLSRSPAGLVVLQHKVLEFDDGLDLEHHELHYNPVTNFDHTALVSRPDAYIVTQGSANGLLLLHDSKHDVLYICNPITRDYIKFHRPQEFLYASTAAVTYGFGVSKMTGQHKVVRIFHECPGDPNPNALQKIPKSECLVYTLGTGSWRSIESGAPLDYSFSTFGVFLNGNLHWLVSDSEDYQWISCFDLETELFSTLSSTPGGETFERLFALGDCLCLCEHDITSSDEIVIWLMKEYGVEKSWTKEFVFGMPDFAFDGGLYAVVCPIKVFADGDILMAWDDCFLCYYSNKTKTSHKVELDAPDRIDATLHTPSFLTLKKFAMENVSSF